MVEGTLAAASREHAVDALRAQALVPVTVEPALDNGTRFSWTLLGTSLRRDRAVWVRTMATLTAAGAPMDRALAVAHDVVTHSGVAAAARDVRTRVIGGSTLADALRAHPAVFLPLHAAMVEAGEATGTLSAACDLLARFLDDDDQWRDQLGAALLYPALMASVATAGVLVLLLVVVPRFAGLLGDLGGTLPWATQLLVTVGTAVRHWWWLGAVVVGAGVAALRTYLAQPAAQVAWHRQRLTWPIVGTLERAVATARFTRGLGTLLSGGQPVLSAWRLAVGGVSNRALAMDLGDAERRIARGESVASAVRGMLSPLGVQLLAVGEEGGALDRLALQAAQAHEEQVRRSLRTVAALVEPAMILLFGAIVGLVALAMLQAIYAVNTGLS
jgi:general secretion pathway protein F